MWKRGDDVPTSLGVPTLSKVLETIMLKVGGLWQSESTTAPWVILVINVNISLVGLTLLPSMFQISSTMEWHGLEDVEPLQDAKDRRLAKAQKLKTLHFI